MPNGITLVILLLTFYKHYHLQISSDQRFTPRMLPITNVVQNSLQFSDDQLLLARDFDKDVYKRQGGPLFSSKTDVSAMPSTASISLKFEFR